MYLRPQSQPVTTPNGRRFARDEPFVGQISIRALMRDGADDWGSAKGVQSKSVFLIAAPIS